MTSKPKFDAIYRKYNKRKYVSPDPLEVLYNYPDIADREIVALVASSLAYGRVAQILKSIDRVLTILGPSPHTFLRNISGKRLARPFANFKHRFTTGADIAAMLTRAQTLIATYGSLNECFVHDMDRTDKTILTALTRFVDQFECRDNYLMPSPSRGSACKRLNLFLRWLVRKDAVDPGGWQGIDAGKLIVPLDTHMARIGRSLALTKRKSANMKMAMEITAAFGKLAPRDPVKYDFALTRFGIRADLDIADLKQLAH